MAVPQAPARAVGRLEELEMKRTRYEELSRKLFTLPQKLRHAGLIPVGPRLFVPGELVRTNELTVLLGACGDDSFFADRSAFQAHGIVQRRLAVIDRRVADIHVGPADVARAGDVQANTTKPSKTANTAKPVKHTNFINPSAAVKAMPSSTVHVGNGSVKSVGSKQKQKKRVSFRDPLVTELGPPSPPRSERHSGKANKAANKSLRQSTPPESKKEDVHTVRSQFDQAVLNAQRQALEGGIINITEVFDSSSEQPIRVELPPAFEPDSSVSFGEDSEDYLDMTGGKTKKVEQPSRDDFLQALLEAERDGEEEQSQQAAARDKMQRKREEKDFGKGFAKGFFGAPSVEDSLSKQKARGAKVETARQVVKAVEEPAVEDKVVERRAPRAGTRRQRKPRASSILASRKVPGTHVIPEEVDPAELEGYAVDIAEGSADRPTVSKFRQIRNLQRQ